MIEKSINGYIFFKYTCIIIVFIAIRKVRNPWGGWEGRVFFNEKFTQKIFNDVTTLNFNCFISIKKKRRSCFQGEKRNNQ